MLSGFISVVHKIRLCSFAASSCFSQMMSAGLICQNVMLDTQCV